jgi:MATE family multidrug resistance protein
MLKGMTSDLAVIEAAKGYLTWLLLMPVVGCAAFTFDGIYIGATASKEMRNSTLRALVAFVAAWGTGMLVLNMWVPAESPSYGYIAMHILMAAYFAHLLARAIYLTFKYRKVMSAVGL